MDSYGFHSVDWLRFAISMFVLAISLSVHELAHAKAAEVAGDDTARKAGRISINPFDHLDPVGTIMMVASSLSGFGIGWAKPVPVNPMNFRHPRRDELMVSLWGPLSNILMAIVGGLAIRFTWKFLGPMDLNMLFLFVMINLGLAIFNLIPIAPLDGSHILSALLPIDQARQYDIFMAQYGFMILVGLVLIGPMMGIELLGSLLGTPRAVLFHSFTGMPVEWVYTIIRMKGG